VEDNPKPFLEHLEELRVRLIKALAAVALGAMAAYHYADRAIGFLSRPVGGFVFLEPTEAFMSRLKVALACGAVLAMPVVLYQAWKYVAVALSPGERRPLYWLLPASYVLFVLGLSFGFLVLVPAGIRFLLGYSTPEIRPMISVGRYLDFVGAVCLALGAVFQMPLLAYFLGRLGVLDAKWLAEKRAVAVLVVYAASALLTPGPDPVTAMLLAVPTYALFECSILSAKAARPAGPPPA